MSLLWGRRDAPGGEERRALTFQSVFSAGGEVSSYSAGPATGVVPLFAAHREIIDAVASVPLHGYSTTAGGTPRQMPRDPEIIRPMVGTRYTWVSQAVISLLSDGNAFGLLSGQQSGWPTSCTWVDPSDVTIDDESALIPVYRYLGQEIDRRSLVHIPWILPPGKWRAISPLKAFRLAWETGASAQQSARDWFAGGAIPSGHLKNLQRTLTATQAAEMKSIFRRAVRGRDVLVTGNDWTYETIGVPADEQRFAEAIRMTASQVAAIYGLPPEDVGGEAANSLTYATVEGNERRRAQRVAAPWCSRIEQALSEQMPRPQYVKFNLDATVRADLLTRMKAHEVALATGMSTLDEARALEDKPPLTPAEWEQWQMWTSARGGKPAAEPDQTQESQP